MKLAPVALAACLSLLAACGGGNSEVGEFKNDWLGNEIKIKSLTDPKIDGVICHLAFSTAASGTGSARATGSKTRPIPPFPACRLAR
jgi:catabolite regulation protein CreA